MEKKFYPDIEYNKKKRRSYFIILALGIILIGGLAITFLLMQQTMIALLVGLFLLLAVSTIPSALANYPIKPTEIITVDDKTVLLYTTDMMYASDIVGVSVCIEVPKVGATRDEQLKNLQAVAATKPTEPVLGTCDILTINAKGKQITKYTIVNDCIGALEALIEAGVKKYKIIYNMKKYTAPAKYLLANVETKEAELNELSEKEKLNQLL